MRVLRVASGALCRGSVHSFIIRVDLVLSLCLSPPLRRVHSYYTQPLLLRVTTSPFRRLCSNLPTWRETKCSKVVYAEGVHRHFRGVNSKNFPVKFATVRCECYVVVFVSLFLQRRKC